MAQQEDPYQKVNSEFFRFLFRPSSPLKFPTGLIPRPLGHKLAESQQIEKHG